jgi:outer membrane putative beta-barrel porin/alpha-amylase
MGRINSMKVVSQPRLLLSVCLLVPVAAHAVSPLFTDDADTVPKGKFQLGSGVEYYKAGSLRRWSGLVNPVVGLNDRWEAGLNFGYQWQEHRDSSGTARADGVLDTMLATKWKWFDQTNHWFSLSTRLDFKIPTASDRRGLGTGNSDLGGVLIATKTVGATSFDFNVGYTLLVVGGSGLGDDEIFIGQTVRHALSERWTLVGEVFGRIPCSGERDATANFNGGVQYFLKPNLVLEAAALTSVGRNSPDLTAYLGFTWVF